MNKQKKKYTYYARKLGDRRHTHETVSKHGKHIYKTNESILTKEQKARVSRDAFKEKAYWLHNILNPENKPPVQEELDNAAAIMWRNPQYSLKMRQKRHKREIEALLDKPPILTKQKRKRKYINLETFKNFSYRYTAPEMEEDLYVTGMYPSTIYKNGKIYKDLNIARKIMHILVMNDPKVLNKGLSSKGSKIKNTDLLEKKLTDTLEKYNFKKYLSNKLARKIVIKKKPLNKASIPNEIVDEADKILDSTGRITYGNQLKGLTSQVMDLMETSSLAVFNNISNQVTHFFIHEISELVVPRIKPVRFSTNKFDIRNSIFELLYDKSNNRYINNNYNQMREPLALSYQRTLSEVVKPMHIDYNNEDVYINDKSFSHEDEMADNQKITGKGLRPNDHKAFHIAYWKYLSTKYPKYQNNKYHTDEFITFKSDPHTMIDTTSEFANETQNYIAVRGSFKSKQFNYDYKINQRKHSLPLVEYFYYSQFGIDKSRLLKLNQFYILNKNLFSVFNDSYANIYPYISMNMKKKKQYNTSAINICQSRNKISKIVTENIDIQNIIEFINYNIYVIVKPKTIETIYLYHNTLIRPMAHWFVQIYYNNIYYFDAFYSWCCDLVSNLIIF